MTAEQTATQTATQTVVANALLAWKQQLESAQKIFAPLSGEQLHKEIAPGKNRLIYLYGHLVAVHDRMLPLLAIGPRLHPQLDAAFLAEKDRTVADADLPSAADLKRMWDEVHEKLNDAFGKFTAEDWAAKHTSVSEEDFAKNPLRNRIAVLFSRTSHIAYHLGQAALVKE
jgi:crotonobetainyl-CoA:carnitine CoA-transferase CaiB-like acyl-CoA transferase